MPIGPFENFDECVEHMQSKENHDEDTAKRICGAMQRDLEKATKMRVLSKSGDRHYTLGVVYEPDVTDSQGEFAKAEDIETAAWAFMERIQMLAKSAALIVKATENNHAIDITELDELIKSAQFLDDEHLQVDDHLGTIVESYIAPADLKIDGQEVKKGAWLLGVVWSESMWNKIKAGDRTGFSMFGTAQRA